MTGLLNDVLPPGVLAQVAGRPVRMPLNLVHSGGPDQVRDKHLLFLVEPGTDQPVAVLKWAGGAEAAGLVREARAAARIRAAGDPLLAASCPPMAGPFATAGDALVTVERYLSAPSVYAQLRTSVWPRPLVAGHFRRAGAWLDRFARATRTPSRPFDQAQLEEYIAEPLQTFASRFDAPAGIVRATLDAARAYLGRPLALTAEHGDFWPANLLLAPSSDEVYMVDWEHYTPATLPGFDMLLFCTTYALAFPWRPFGWASPATAVVRAYTQAGPLRAPMTQLLAQVCAAAALPPAMLPVLLPVMMCRMALRQAASTTGTTAAASWNAALSAWWGQREGSWLETWAATAGD
jgi:Phosphotransferase enzyme family